MHNNSVPFELSNSQSNSMFNTSMQNDQRFPQANKRFSQGNIDPLKKSLINYPSKDELDVSNISQLRSQQFVDNEFKMSKSRL
jgi:hypothetical protein